MSGRNGLDSMATSASETDKGHPCDPVGHHRCRCHQYSRQQSYRRHDISSARHCRRLRNPCAVFAGAERLGVVRDCRVRLCNAGTIEWKIPMKEAMFGKCFASRVTCRASLARRSVRIRRFPCGSRVRMRRRPIRAVVGSILPKSRRSTRLFWNSRDPAT